MRDTGVTVHLGNVTGIGAADVVLLEDHVKVYDEIACEVERLRTQLDNALNKRLSAEHSLLDAKEQLAEQDALLRKALEYIRADGGFTLLDDEIEDYLSASAEEQKNV